MKRYYDEQEHAEWLANKILAGESVGTLNSGSSMPVYFDLQDILDHYEPEVSDEDAVSAWINGNWDEILRCDQFEAEEFAAEMRMGDAA